MAGLCGATSLAWIEPTGKIQEFISMGRYESKIIRTRIGTLKTVIRRMLRESSASVELPTGSYRIRDGSLIRAILGDANFYEASDVIKAFPGFRHYSSGNYRMVFRTTEDSEIVIKVALGEDAAIPNIVEGKLGHMSDMFLVFPKAYAFDAEGKWVVQEKVRVAKSESEVADFFFLGHLADVDHETRWAMVLFHLMADEERKSYFGQQIEAKVVKGAGHEKLLEASKILSRNRSFNAWAKAIRKFDIGVDELRAPNMGFSFEDGRPLILDASIFSLKRI